MKHLFRFLALISLIGMVYSEEGWLVIIGGGKRPDYLIEEIIKLAGGNQAPILIVPAASEDQLDSSLYARHQFESCGAENVRYILLKKEEVDSPKNLSIVKKCKAIFFTGGDQNRLTSFLLGTKFLEEIKRIYMQGGVISGTSAGAAVMSKIMITGEELLFKEEKKDEEGGFRVIKRNNVQTAEGFGFLENVIIDQHFIKRKRLNRLISVVLENPGLIGVGIDEETAIIVEKGKKFKVLGEGTVMIFDARRAKEISEDKNGNITVKNLRVHILKSGEYFDLQKGEPI
jgi:cyanophycinase